MCHLSAGEYELPRVPLVIGPRFGPDGRTLLAGDEHGAVTTWAADTLARREVYALGEGAPLALDVAPDGLTALAGFASGRAVVWGLA